MSAKRILLVDDDPVTLLAVGKLLERQGHEVTRCSESAEAVTLALKRAWDLIILDLVLPSPKPGLIVQFDGLKMLGWIERLNRRVPVIVLTSEPAAVLARKVASAGAFAVVGKQERTGTLLDTVRKALESAPAELRFERSRTNEDGTATSHRPGSSRFRALLRLFC